MQTAKKENKYNHLFLMKYFQLNDVEKVTKTLTENYFSKWRWQANNLLKGISDSVKSCANTINQNAAEENEKKY